MAQKGVKGTNILHAMLKSSNSCESCRFTEIFLLQKPYDYIYILEVSLSDTQKMTRDELESETTVRGCCANLTEQ